MDEKNLEKSNNQFTFAEGQSLTDEGSFHVGEQMEELEIHLDLPVEEEEELPDYRHKSEKSIPKEALFFAARTLFAALLLALSCISTMSHSWCLGFRITAFIICALGTMAAFVRDALRMRFLTRNLAFLLITCAAAGTGQLITASLSILLLEVGTALLDHYAGIRLRDAERKLETPRIKRDKLTSVCAERVTEDIRRRSFKQIAYFKAFYNYYLWVILGLAIIIGGIVPLFDSFTFIKWLYRAGVVVVAASFGYLGDILAFLVQDVTGQLFSKKIYFQSVDTLQSLSQVTSVVFNKTGVITEGHFKVTDVDPIRISEDELLFLASYAECCSEHPLAKAVIERAGIQVDKSRVEKHTETRGVGCVVQMSGQILSIGSIELMETLGIKGDFGTKDCTSAFVAVGKTYVGRIDFEDSVKDSSSRAVRELKECDVPNIALMTGDNAILATSVGRAVGITEIYADCLPRDKISRLRYILETRDKDDHLAVITDSSEDGELLALAETGILLKKAATQEDMDINGVDMIIRDSDPALVSGAVTLSKSVNRRFNLLWLISMILEGVLTIASASGMLELWAAVLAQLLIQGGILAAGLDWSAVCEALGLQKFGVGRQKK